MTAILEAPGQPGAGIPGRRATCAPSWDGPNTSRIAARYRVPIVVTGFEPLDILEGMYLAVRQLEEGRHEVENQYVRAVRRDGGRVPAQ